MWWSSFTLFYIQSDQPQKCFKDRLHLFHASAKSYITQHMTKDNIFYLESIWSPITLCNFKYKNKVNPVNLCAYYLCINEVLNFWPKKHWKGATMTKVDIKSLPFLHTSFFLLVADFLLYLWWKCLLFMELYFKMLSLFFNPLCSYEK